MLRENDNLPVEQFNLDVKEQRRLEDTVEQEAERVLQPKPKDDQSCPEPPTHPSSPHSLQVRAETEQSIIEMCYLWDVLKRECWDSWMVKSRAIKVELTFEISCLLLS